MTHPTKVQDKPLAFLIVFHEIANFKTLLAQENVQKDFCL